MQEQGTVGPGAKRPRILKRGTIACGIVEATPVVFGGRLYRFEYIRAEWPGNETGDSFFRFVDVETGESTPPFAYGTHLGSAFVDVAGVAWVFGTSAWGGSRIRVFRSDDLRRWDEPGALDMPGWGAYNTSVCRDADGYAMAIELGEPREIVGHRFTIFFARSPDLVRWEMEPLDRVWRREEYSACPALRFVDGRYIMVYLERYRPDWKFCPHVVRSADLVRWEESPLNPFLEPSEEDHAIANPALTGDDRDRIAGAVDINNSDVDFCTVGGETVITYSWGNQRGTEFLAEAVCDLPEAEMLAAFFPGGEIDHG